MKILPSECKQCFVKLLLDLGNGVPRRITLGLFFCMYWVDRYCGIQFTGVLMECISCLVQILIDVILYVQTMAVSRAWERHLQVNS